VRYWFFALLLIAIPLINIIAVPMLAFVGRDQTKKNFYRALILWVMILIGIHIVAILIVGGPKLIEVLLDLAPGGVDGFLQQQLKPEVQ
jgi:hypothetical protein